MTDKTNEQTVKISVAFEDALAFAFTEYSVNGNNELVAKTRRNGVDTTKVISSHATAEEADAEKVEYEEIAKIFQSQMRIQARAEEAKDFLEEFPNISLETTADIKIEKQENGFEIIMNCEQDNNTWYEVYSEFSYEDNDDTEDALYSALQAYKNAMQYLAEQATKA